MRSRILCISSLVIFLVTPTLGNVKYFRMVQETAKIYRVEVSPDKMKLVSDGNGGQTFYIDLKSNRNNFEMVMVVGYIAAGEAMKTGVEPSEIYVSVDVPIGGGYRLVTMATKQDVRKLLDGEINMYQFSRLVNYI